MSEILTYIPENIGYILALTGEHLKLTGVAILFAILVAVPLGILLTRYKKVASAVIAAVGVLQTIPSLALLAVMIQFFGIGFTPAVIALFLYSLLPILRNTYTGINEVSYNMVKAARGMGMTKVQIIVKVQVPIAMPIILAGVRTAAVICVGTATLAAFIGNECLGTLIYRGLTQFRTDLILTGAIFSALLAILIDSGFAFLTYLITPKGLRSKRKI